MSEVIVGVRGRLVKDGAKDIDLVVHRHYLNQSSPCVVIEDWADRRGIGGSIQTVEQIFELELAKHPGYVVNDRTNLMMIEKGESEAKEPEQKDVQPRRDGVK
jgi:hypothetical protein